MYDVLVGSGLIAAFLGGAVALFAPCCISVMLPAYFAMSFRRRQALVAMTFVFAAGVGTVIRPVAFGASGISRLIFGHHAAVFLAMGMAMAAMGAATLAGWRMPMPGLGMRASGGRGAGSVYVLGVFSGTATACCAPVLAGVVALSSATATFLSALAIGGAYLFGMILPLFLMALLWDRHDWGNSTLLRGRSVRLPIPGQPHSAPVASLLASGLLVVMGALTVFIGVSGPSMADSGWQADVTARLDHYASLVQGGLGRLPGWVVAIVLAAAIAALARVAVRQTAVRDEGVPPPEDDPAPGAEVPAIRQPLSIEGGQ